MAKSTNLKIPILAAFIALAALSACAFHADSSAKTDRRRIADNRAGKAAPGEEVRTIAAAHNALGFNLLKQSSATAPTENVLISPLSIALALDMTLNGAAGNTRELMLQTLGVTDIDPLRNSGDSSLSSYLQERKGKSVLKIANALWANKGVDLKADFVDTNRKNFKARLEVLDFQNPDAARVINQWVKTETAGQIPSIIDDTNGEALLYLTNATYFKGIWSEPFARDETKDGDFTRQGSRPVKVRQMLKQGEMSYLAGDGFQAVRLPYDDTRTDLCVFLPGKGKDLSAFVETLNVDNWTAWQRGFRTLPGTLKIPRFKVGFKTELKEWLSALGMAVAFDPDRADFSAMSDTAAYIGKVIHRTVMEVDEEGTVAAAATAVEMMPTSARADPDPPFEMVVDRPFLVAVVDRETGAVIFIGTIGDPGQ